MNEFFFHVGLATVMIALDLFFLICAIMNAVQDSWGGCVYACGAFGFITALIVRFYTPEKYLPGR